MSAMIKPDPKLDLVLERVVDVPRELVWKAWTTPEHLKHWFVPKPWTITDCEIDLRRGGIFRTVMRSPEGQEFPNVGLLSRHRPERTAGLDRRAAAGLSPIGEAVLHRGPANCTRRAGARVTSRPPCTATRKAASSTRTWASMTAGAPSSTRWWRM